jgi:hypothetical protein
VAAKKRTDEQNVRIAPLGELRGYTISEHELEKFEQGGTVSDLLYCRDSGFPIKPRKGEG